MAATTLGRCLCASLIYRSIGSVAVFEVYNGVAHSYTNEILEDLQVFFAANR